MQIPRAVNLLLRSKAGRRPLFSVVDRLLRDRLGNEVMQEKQRQFIMGLLKQTIHAMDNQWLDDNCLKDIANNMVAAFTGDKLTYSARETFQQRYGFFPPSFITLSPTQRCNLRCSGCYASAQVGAPTLPYSIIRRITQESFADWGNRFMTISGGEPFLYKDADNTLFDLWAEFPGMYFLVYSNGTVITRKIAERLARLGNVTVALSIEGYETQTDARRGTGTYAKILSAMSHLRAAGVPFGISMTATQSNADLLLQDRFYDFYFREMGAIYMWQFQLMPVGKATEMRESMVTPQQRVRLYRKWKEILLKGYPVADFWNSGIISGGCIAYGRTYLYIDWEGKVMPCVFVPYYTDTVQDLFARGKPLAEALLSPLFVNGRRWQHQYSKDNPLMPCSIRDHYLNFRQNILPPQAKPENVEAAYALTSEEYAQALYSFDQELEELTTPVWHEEYAFK